MGIIMTNLDKFLAPRKSEATTTFAEQLVVPDVGILNVSGIVAKADSKAFRQAMLDCKRAVAGGLLDVEQFESELIGRIVTDAKADDDTLSDEQVKQLLTNYPQLVEAIDRAASKGAVFTVPQLSGSSTTPSATSGLPNPTPKAATSQGGKVGSKRARQQKK